ncbi:hypothetical protein BDB00DRAFT_743213, partial [Zychaea mexicana]|uniref:uncharacterized protein n=1 Tax=Zychaea mexicana TaxID=64656 RepID=UPI0022FE66D0
TGFMTGRLIADNGLLAHPAMSHVQTQAQQQHPGVIFLWHQKKAYDRIAPGYLEQIICNLYF